MTPAELNRIINDTHLALINTGEFYNKIIPMLEKVLNSAPDYDNYWNARQLVLRYAKSEYEFWGVNDKVGLRRAALTKLVEDIIEYYFYDIVGSQFSNVVLSDIRHTFYNGIFNGDPEILRKFINGTSASELKTGDVVHLTKVKVKDDPIRPGHRFDVLPGMLDDGLQTIHCISPEGYINLVSCAFAYHPSWITKTFIEPAVIKPEEIHMSSTPIVTNPTLINGQPTDSFTDDAIFGLISQTEKEIARLEAQETKPKKLEARIEMHKADIKALVDIVDSRE